MKIKIIESNKEKIDIEINKIEKNCKVRCSSFDILSIICKDVEKRLNELNVDKKNKVDMEFVICTAAQKFPGAYRGVPHATIFTVKYFKSGVFVTQIYRGICNSRQIIMRNEDKFKQFYRF